MIEAEFFYKQLIDRGAGFFCGVPDSLLKSFCAYITDHSSCETHCIAVNEGAAIGLAAGYHLATGGIPVVYMQNSGIGNAINPLLSLADSDVYRIPMALVIGWRGEPGVSDEPQHVKQGKVTLSLLEAMNIPYSVLSTNEQEAAKQIQKCFNTLTQKSAPFALVIQKDTFAPYTLQTKTPDPAGAVMTREEAIETIIETIITKDGGKGIIVSTTGMASRELFELREKYKMGHERDFLTVGSMGHAASIALGIALQRPELPVTILDGDGASLMHLGALRAIGDGCAKAETKLKNLRHIVLNNEAHDSVGGQPTIAGFGILANIASASGYPLTYQAKNPDELKRALTDTGAGEGARFIEVSVKKGARKDLGRPTTTPQENKRAFMDYINEETRRKV
ncbi:MAG: phosphonopyruvate decarboxylase [Treponemataceae bacterium]|nr:MAG: phosphonopyruvate decarboxylase [Treponemataceae bacterium]